MPDNNLNITDEQLIEELKKSFITQEQQKELKALIPEMTDDEKNELLNLINKANDEALKDDPEYQKRLSELNKEFTEKMNNYVREESEKTLKDIEAKDKEKSTEELQKFETEIGTMNTEKKVEKSSQVSSENKHKHTARKILLIMLLLILITGGTLYALSIL